MYICYVDICYVDLLGGSLGEQRNFLGWGIVETDLLADEIEDFCVIRCD